MDIEIQMQNKTKGVLCWRNCTFWTWHLSLVNSFVECTEN